MNKNNRFITELRARGLNITPQEERTLMNIAIAEHDKTNSQNTTLQAHW